ncbi:MAG: hypothetical protein AABZ80_09430 [Gemmatimonadota bacterium]
MITAILRLVALRPLLTLAIFGVPILMLIAVGLLTIVALKVLIFVVLPIVVVVWAAKKVFGSPTTE